MPPHRETGARSLLRRLAAEPGGVALLAQSAGLSGQHVRDVLSGRKHGRAGTRERLIAASADAVRTRRGERIPPRGVAFRSTAADDMATLAAFMASKPQRRCVGCGGALSATRADAVYCGDGCRSRAKRRRKATGKRRGNAPPAGEPGRLAAD